MPDLVQFELVSPERLILSTEVEMVVVPGTEGNFGVLPGHAPLISTIRPGTIDIYENQAVARRIFVVGAIEAELQTVQGNLPSLREQVARATGTERDNLLVELRRLERQQNVLQAELQALAETTR